MCKPLTIAGVAHKYHIKENDKRLKEYVESTNAYRKMWPLLFAAYQKDPGGPEHLRLLRIESELHRKQKRSGTDLGILCQGGEDK